MEILNEDESIIRDSAAGFLKEKAPVDHMRALRDAGDELGYSTDLKDQMAEMGWFAMLLPEDAGGLGMGTRAAGLVAEETGRNLTPSPFLSSGVMAATALAAGGGAALKNWGEKLATGEAVIALAIEEGVKHAPMSIATKAETDGNGFVLTGQKEFVLDGHEADRLIVSAKLDDQIGMFLVDPNADGVTSERLGLLDSRNAVRVKLDSVKVDGADIVGSVADGVEILEKTLRSGRAVLASEMQGISREVSERTLAYLNERKQFGIQIGRFQALQFRAADLYAQIEASSSLVAAAQRAIDTDDPRAERLSRAAKAKASAVCKLAVEEALQMHGGIGMTDALDIGLFMKRAQSAVETLGDTSHHAEWMLQERGI